MKQTIIAHRGIFNNQDIPENSLKAFQKSLLLGIAFELDVQLTKDNILVVFHDESLLRMVGVDLKIEELFYRDLEKFSLLSTSEKIPTLKEVLALTNNKVLIDIEIKPTKKISKICNILYKELEHYSNFTVKSFHPKIVRYLKKHYSHWKVGYLIDFHYDSFFFQLLLPSFLVIFYTKADFLSINKKLLKKKKFLYLHKKYPFTVWTIKNSPEINDSSFTYICNNLPFY